ncbi:hypothetical protein [uncultured Sneathiella sp.]|uniref:hypothetical protein n=1 Tax=uncultured Sneathiella sp. TaxID=879315 RepID=UPI0030EC2AD8|tara:strand:- start:1351 stop:1569 length:219 start_codon:yes stop_codon:yes gene_type:complete
MIKRSLGKGPRDSSGLAKCPEVLELENGDFAFIGIRATSTLKPYFSEGISCGPDEEVVVLPREVIISAIKKV